MALFIRTYANTCELMNSLINVDQHDGHPLAPRCSSLRSCLIAAHGEDLSAMISSKGIVNSRSPLAIASCGLRLHRGVHQGHPTTRRWTTKTWGTARGSWENKAIWKGTIVEWIMTVDLKHSLLTPLSTMVCYVTNSSWLTNSFMWTFTTGFTTGFTESQEQLGPGRKVLGPAGHRREQPAVGPRSHRDFEARR